MPAAPHHRYQSGVNLGGWLSQYPTQYSPQALQEHFASFITRADIEQIASWGMDHVRLPIDYPVLENDHQPGFYLESGFGNIDRCLEWCQAAGLGVVLDLHKAPGFAFDNLQAASLFQQPAQQARYLNLWQALAQRYQNEGDYLAFELLNEIVLPDSAPWNQLARQAVQRIRQSNPQRWIVIGGNYYNAAAELANLDVLEDPRILYTFHFYEPMIFTHQKAYWMPVMQAFRAEVEYPADCPDLTAFLNSAAAAQLPAGHAGSLKRYAGLRLDQNLLQTFLQPALDFRERSGRPLYCGEFGVIDQAPVESNLRWHRDLVALLDAAGIGGAVWSYKQMDFGLVNAAGQVNHPALIEILSKRAG